MWGFDARPRAQKTRRARSGDRKGTRFAASAAALLIASVGALALTPPASAAAATLPVPPDADVQARVLSHVGTDAGVAVPDLGDCIRYGSAPQSTTTGPIANPGGTPGTQAAGWSDGATGWVAFDSIAYTAHGDSGRRCGGPDLNLSTQSAVGFGPASVSSIEIGTPFNLGRMVHRNNVVQTLSHAWSSGVLEVRFLGLDLSYPWTLHETSNTQSPASNPANDDVLQFTGTIGDQSFVGSDGNRYTLVVSGFTAPQADGTCAASLADPGSALGEFLTVEQTSTYGCLYASIRQVRTLTVVKIAEAAQAQAAGIPAFSFTSTSDLAGSPWATGFSLTPTALGAAGQASTATADFVVGETVTIAESTPAAPWAFTSVACVDGTGAVVPAQVAGAQITLTGDLTAASADAAPITCTYTNTDTTVPVDPTGSLTLAKTVTPRDGTSADGYNGGDARVFAVDFVCTLDGIPAASGTRDLTIATPVTITGIPAGAECEITGEDESPAAGDFTDASYAWDGYDLSPASVTIATDTVSTLTIDNRFVRTPPVEPTDPPIEPTDPPVAPPGPLPLSDGTPNPLAATGSGPILPFAFAGAGLLLAGAVALGAVRRSRRRA